MSKFQIGDDVRKVIGYPFEGKVATTYPDEDKCVVRHADGWDHVFHDRQLAYNHPEYQYLDLLKMLVAKSEREDPRTDRTGVGTWSVFGRQIRFDLAKGFPLLTTKHVAFRSLIAELVWFLRGDTNTHFLHERKCSIWDEWADENGDLGPVYGKQWRSWDDPLMRRTIDQIAEVILNLVGKPHDRGHIVSAWNVAELEAMALRPCHCLFQFYVENGKLSCQLYQRSADIFLGVPFNIASYAALVHVIARSTGLEVGEFVHTFGDLHLYSNHIEQARTQIDRAPLPFPELTIDADPGVGFHQLDVDHFRLNGYVHHPKISAPVAV